MKIGRVATAARGSVATIRFYERERLLPRPSRNLAGYRLYSADVFDRLRFIREAKELGFALREIRELLKLGVRSTNECGPLTRRAEARLVAMNEEIRRLQRSRRGLVRLICNCGGTCASRSRGRAGRWRDRHHGRAEGSLMEVVIYTSVGCSACHQAKRFMTEHGIGLVERNLAEDPSALSELIAAGYRAVPVIRVGDETMVGFSPVKLRKLLAL